MKKTNEAIKAEAAVRRVAEWITEVKAQDTAWKRWAKEVVEELAGGANRGPRRPKRLTPPS